jgi:hypothetical protein
MDYLEFKLWKLGLLGLAAFCWGIFCGFNGLPLSGVRREAEGAEARGPSER